MSSLRSEGKIISQSKSKDIFKNLKNDYFLGIVFNNLKKKRSLNIIKYNKDIKNRINININDYKEYWELHSPIEIEIKLTRNKQGKFININKEEENYFHIYFNNDKKRIKRYYINKYDDITKIKIIIDYQVKSFQNLFYYCDCISSICFNKFYRNDINNMNSMFCGCTSLLELNINNFKTNSVTDMSCMFKRCIVLKELNVKNFNTNNVTDMSWMFQGCAKLKELNVNNFNTNNVTNMSFMFSQCKTLE